MSILKIARMGHPVLRRKADPVDDPTAPEIAALVADMIETLTDSGGIGLAAPQVHVPLRVVIYMVPEGRLSDAEGDHASPLRAIVNPLLTPLTEVRDQGWEGCLSIPGMRGAVGRYRRIRVQATGLDGSSIDEIASGFHARVLQHECDHLDGVLYPQRMTDLGRLSFVEESLAHPIELEAPAP